MQNQPNSKSHSQLENSFPTLANILCLRNFLNGFLMLSFKFAKLCQWISKCEILLRYLKLCKKTNLLNLSQPAGRARSHLLAKILLTRLKRKLANFSQLSSFPNFKSSQLSEREVSRLWCARFNLVFYLIKILEKCTNFTEPGAAVWPQSPLQL